LNPPPPACEDLPIILANKACCSALSPLVSISDPFPFVSLFLYMKNKYAQTF
jgi:hypothetical protein